MSESVCVLGRAVGRRIDPALTGMDLPVLLTRA